MADAGCDVTVLREEFDRKWALAREELLRAFASGPPAEIRYNVTLDVWDDSAVPKPFLSAYPSAGIRVTATVHWPVTAKEEADQPSMVPVSPRPTP